MKYDQVVHVYGSAVGTWACWQGLRVATNLRVPKPGPIAVCVAAGMGLGAFNEVVEFLTTRFVEDTNVGGYENTGWDLVANTLGAAIAGVGIYRSGPSTASTV